MTRRQALQRAARLAGYLSLPPGLTAVLTACRTDEAAARDYVPTFLSPEAFATLGTLLDELLPATTTPGALDVGVDRFIDQALPLLASPEEAATLNRLLTSTPAVLTRVAFLPAPAFTGLKRLALLGYFTSEPILTDHLNFHPAPGRFDGCVPAGSDTVLYANLDG